MTDAPWWDDARYGLFVHWGVMSLPARGDWVMQREHIPVAEYERLGEQFTAEAWDPAAQAALARRAGMRYGVLVTRHHDGFCLWDTATDHFKATNTPAGRDLVAEWVDAFRSAGLRVGLYYSLLDWRAQAYWRGPLADPDGWAAFRAQVHGQLLELLTRLRRDRHALVRRLLAPFGRGVGVARARGDGARTATGHPPERPLGGPRRFLDAGAVDQRLAAVRSVGSVHDDERHVGVARVG